MSLPVNERPPDGRSLSENISSFEGVGVFFDFALSGDIDGLQDMLNKDRERRRQKGIHHLDVLLLPEPLCSFSLGVNVNVQDYDRRTALHLAAAGGKLEACQFLVKNGAKLHPDRHGMLAIHDAVMNGHVEVRDFLQDMDLTCPYRITAMPKPTMRTFSEAATPIAASTSELEMKVTQVFSLIAKEGVFSYGRVWEEVQYYFTELGFHPKYFHHFTSAQIAGHIHCLMAAKKVSQTTKSQNIQFEIEDEHQAFFLTTLSPNGNEAYRTEKHVERYLANTIASSKDSAFSVTYMRSDAPAMRGGRFPLGIYIVERTHFESHRSFGNEGPEAVAKFPKAYGNTSVPGKTIQGSGPRLFDEDDLQLVATTKFLKTKTREGQLMYQRMLRNEWLFLTDTDSFYLSIVH